MTDLVVHRFPLTASGEQTLGTGEGGKEEADVMVLGRRRCIGPG